MNQLRSLIAEQAETMKQFESHTHKQHAQFQQFTQMAGASYV